MAATAHSNTKIPWQDLFLPWRIVRNFQQFGELVAQFTKREVTGRYRGSYLGIFWSFLNPLIMLAVYAFVFGVIFHGSFLEGAHESRIDFGLGLFCGLNFYNAFAECFSRAPLIILSNPNYVTKVVFPLEILPLSVAGGAMIHFFIAMIPLLAGILIAHGAIPLTAFYAIPLVIPLFLFSLGCTWFIASLGVFVRDIGPLMTPLITIIMYASAIFYPIKSLPPIVRPFMRLNPLADLAEQARGVLVFGEPLNWPIYFALLVASVIVFVLGYAFFMKTKSAFADVM